MFTFSRTAKRFALLSVLVVLLIGGLAACGGPASAQQNTAVAQPNATSVVRTYLQLFNAGMRSGDFSAMASVYAPDATVSRSTPEGETFILRGLNSIIAYYSHLSRGAPGVQFYRDKWYDLSPSIVLNYEHATGPGYSRPTLCSHLFVLQKGKIHQLFWVAYYAGKR